jgi:spermidine synthase
VEIDPMLVKLSNRFNASGIYENPKVHVHVDDARAFLRRSSGGYDMVVFGFLDSQTLFSSMSNIRLDGYIYTVQSMQSAFRLLNDNGVLSLSFMAGHEWLARKLVRMVELATGQMPAVYESQGQVVICAFRGHHADPPPNLAGSHVQSSPQATTCPMPLPPQTTGPFFISLAKPSHRTT